MAINNFYQVVIDNLAVQRTIFIDIGKVFPISTDKPYELLCVSWRLDNANNPTTFLFLYDCLSS